MVFGEFAAGKYLRLACTAVLPTWVLIWLYVAFISSSADSISLRPCSVHAAASFGSHRRELHRLELLPYAASLPLRPRTGAAGGAASLRSAKGTAAASDAARHVVQLQHAAGAFAYVCMQPHCNLALMCLSAGALRDVGGWAGPIYVITDHPASLLTHCEVEVTEVYSPSRDEAGVHSIMAAPLALLPAGMERVVLLAPGTITVACLAPFLAYLAGLEHELGMSIAPDDTRWRGRVFDAGLVVFRDTGASRDCSSAWARDLVARVAAQGAAADSAASLAAVEGDLAQGGCRRHHRLPKRFFVAMDSPLFVIKAKVLVQSPVFAQYSERSQRSWLWHFIERSLERQLASLPAG